MEYKLQLHEFFIEGGNREKSHVLLHVTEPSTAEERQKGYFFAVCELNNATTKDIIKLQNIVDEIEARYYEAPENINEHSLETILKKINRENQLSGTNNLSQHCVIGVICNQRIVFSFCGQPKMLLFYKTKEDLYKKMDLISSNQEEENEQLFSQIVEGKITPYDFLFIATPALNEYFNDDRLQKIITSRPALQSAQHIERVLSDIRQEISFGGMVIHLREDQPSLMSKIKKRPSTGGGSVKSLRNLFATEKNTADTMSPSLFPKLNERFNNAFEKKEENQINFTDNAPAPMPAEINSSHLRQFKAKKPEPNQGDIYKKILSSTAKNIWLGLRYLVGILWGILVILFKFSLNTVHFLSLLFLVATNHQNRRRNILENWSKQWHSFILSIINLPKTTKIFFASSIFILIIFISSIFIIRTSQIRKAQEKYAQETIRQIIAHKEVAESALIYKDNSSAINESRAANQLISKLNCKKYQKECNDLTREINNILSQVRKEVSVQAELLYDWKQSAPTLNYLAKIDSQIFVLSANSSTIMVYDLLTKQPKIIKGPIGQFNDIYVPKENDYAAILSDHKNIFLYNPKDGSFKAADISYPKDSVNIANLIVYNRRLYSLDTLNNQIYKHENIKSGFGPGKEWIKDLAVNVKNGASMTTDGDMFISKTDGTIEKLTAGNKQLFEISGLDPILQNYGEVWTYTDRQYIYLLDSVGKRLIILEKDGRLKTQITSEQWKAPTSMIIDEVNKRAFILDSNKLYQINL